MLVHTVTTRHRVLTLSLPFPFHLKVAPTLKCKENESTIKQSVQILRKGTNAHTHKLKYYISKMPPRQTVGLARKSRLNVLRIDNYNENKQSVSRSVGGEAIGEKDKNSGNKKED